MSTLSTGALTLLDWAKGLDPSGHTADTVELLNQTNEVLDDMQWVEGNLPIGHLTTVRTGLPSVAWRLMNAGVTPSKSTKAQITESCGMLEAWSEVDVELAQLNGDVKKFRHSEALSFIEAMNQEFVGTLFYGNSGTAPQEFTGLAPRYASTSAGNGANIISGGGSDSDLSSIWLINWGDGKVKGIFPKGSKAGISNDDFGQETAETTAGIGGTRLRVYRERFVWKAGIALEDWRQVVRIANIDISNLVAKSSAADLIELMIKAIWRIPQGSLKSGSPAFYMNRSCGQMLDIQRRDDVISGGGLTYETVDGKMVKKFRGIPIRIVDQLTQAESAIS